MVIDNVRSAAELREALGELSLSDFSTLKKLTFSCDSSTSEARAHYNLEMVLSSDKPVDNWTIVLKFEHVSGLKAKSFGGALTQITGLFVKNIRDQGWEDQNWEVGDFENGAISFWCKRLSLIALEPTDQMDAGERADRGRF
jgi:hypothetical protein